MHLELYQTFMIEGFLWKYLTGKSGLTGFA